MLAENVGEVMHWLLPHSLEIFIPSNNKAIVIDILLLKRELEMNTIIIYIAT